MKIVLTGGGTGGHLIPLVAVARKLREKNPGIELLFMGPKGEMEKTLMAQEGIPVKYLLAGKMRRYFSLWNVVDFFKVPIGIIQALWMLLWDLPDAIFSKGGYASVPVVLVGWIYRIPTLIHESDSVPGSTNIVLAKFADRVAVSYPEAESYFPPSQVVLTGNPLREDVINGDPNQARAKFSLIESKKVIFIYGGSQGSRTINNRILNILPKLLDKYQVIHQTGEKNYEEVKHRAGELGIKAGREGYYPIAFIDTELKDIYAVSDLVIIRAGANTISEAAANGKPAIIIPISDSANNHQRMNAFSLAKLGACIVLEENNLGENILMENIESIMENSELSQKLARNIQSFYHPDATEKIAVGLLNMLK